MILNKLKSLFSIFNTIILRRVSIITSRAPVQRNHVEGSGAARPLKYITNNIAYAIDFKNVSDIKINLKFL